MGARVDPYPEAPKSAQPRCCRTNDFGQNTAALELTSSVEQATTRHQAAESAACNLWRQPFTVSAELAPLP
eukprot:CAMPEP_0172548492 /NCGR_PEP_ID=MMETSP1067-20121228/17776_1 /TAXON_ID=265564 ORGANISM="Thalassiosira punctigera, Strain Tpunct2005C2" /NCGR_SAMPLE_ID=MMETSP1067 /ASSEMBLY_ACC=CAM_ASM_000444 /LENGTH=70 /DNA_ID=CAMNT_0013335717 /DNA_START=28 /DNA_END=236 /DNA_ORIENTATION=+